MKLNVELQDQVTRIVSDESEIRISIYLEPEKPIVKQPGIGILFFKKQITNIFRVESGLDIQGHQWDKIILIKVPSQLELEYALRGFINEALKNKIRLPKHLRLETIPNNMQKLVQDFVQQQLFIINHFGEGHLLSGNTPKAKTQHRWNKAVSEIPFFVNMPDSKAEIQWIKRNEMVIRAGAMMKKEVPLNQDGSLGFAAKMGQKVRDDHHGDFENFETKHDIILKSVNEVSLFLYFAGRNSWLVFKDQAGKTIDEWTRIE